MWSMWDAPSDRDYYDQFNPEPEEDEVGAMSTFHYGRQLAIHEAVCPLCESVFSHCDRDEEGAPEIADLQRCAAADCETFLCPAGCMVHFSFVCAGCGKRFCHVHAVFTEGRDGFCRGCFLDTPDDETGCTPKEIEGESSFREVA